MYYFAKKLEKETCAKGNNNIFGTEEKILSVKGILVLDWSQNHGRGANIPNRMIHASFHSAQGLHGGEGPNP